MAIRANDFCGQSEECDCSPGRTSHASDDYHCCELQVEPVVLFEDGRVIDEPSFAGKRLSEQHWAKSTVHNMTTVGQSKTPAALQDEAVAQPHFCLRRFVLDPSHQGESAFREKTASAVCHVVDTPHQSDVAQ